MIKLWQLKVAPSYVLPKSAIGPSAAPSLAVGRGGQSIEAFVLITGRVWPTGLRLVCRTVIELR
jgi:hypothetical protein